MTAQAIIALKRQGASVLLSQQNVRFADMVADRKYVVEKGEVAVFMADGNPPAKTAKLKKGEVVRPDQGRP